jgi:hypothetical protein
VAHEGFCVSRIGFEHLKRLVPGDIRDLDQVRASLHRNFNLGFAEHYLMEQP